MSEETGACLVLIPAQNSLPDEVDGGQHITLAYLGDTNLDTVQELELLQLAGKLANQIEDDIELRTKDIEYFGDDGDAVVVTFDDHPENVAAQIRNMAIDEFSSELYLIYKKAETFPNYKPHMTLGYKSEGFVESDHDLDLPESVEISGIAVWNGNSRTTVRFRNNSSIAQYGIIRKSGRYPWGSGEDPFQRSQAFYSAYNELKKEGLDEKEIARLFGERATPKNPDFNTQALRDTRSLAKDEMRAGQRTMVLRLRSKGMGNQAIATRLGMPESTVRSLLKDSVEERVNITKITADKLRENVSEDRYLDIGKGTENRMHISSTRLKTAVSILKDEGYSVRWYKVPTLGTQHKTNTKILIPPGVDFSEVSKHPERIKTIDSYTTDGGSTWVKAGVPKSVNSKKLTVVYAEDGGTQRDGLIEIRPGAKDLDLGSNRYVQVRIAVDGSHYLKGMAVYADDLPTGSDIRFNTNKKRADTSSKLDVLKPLKRDLQGNVDEVAPFGSQIKAGGQRGALNLVNEEGDWDQWSTKFSSQMLSKQSEALAKRQLNLTAETKRAELDEIKALTNPTVKAKLLQAFADNADSSATTLKAMAMNRTTNKVILPFPEMKETEVYAPTYKNGEKVVLIRHPHGGIFEIPELVVNNRHPKPRDVLGNATDAIGIHPSVAEQLSGADFDGDTVLVIPQGSGPTKLRTKSPLRQLKDFDAKELYKGYPGMKPMSKKHTQKQMGEISNLITDMTIKGANENDIAAAVRHSMVVIDAEKHKLDYRRSAVDNGIARLKEIYQPEGGASTIISRAKRRIDVPKYKERPASEGGPIDPKTGRKMFVPTGESYEKLVKDRATGKETLRTIIKKQQSREMDEATDARTLVSSPSGTPIEFIYADHANALKGIGNEARKEMLATPKLQQSPSAKETYAAERESLRANLKIALQNAPLERQAQIVGNAILKAKMDANPDMDADDIKKARTRALDEARSRTGARKQQVPITPREWDAIQAGAISNSMLEEILNNTDLDTIKEYATPRSTTGVNPSVLGRAQSMLNRGYTQAEVAEALGISVSTLAKALR